MEDDTTGLGLFGDMDVDKVPDDPWFVEAGVYLCRCTEAKVVQVSKGPNAGSSALFIQYTIDEPDSQYHGKMLSDYYQLFPGQRYEDLDANEKTAVSRMKLRLRQGFDVPEAQLKSVQPSDLIGAELFITVKNTPGKGEHTGKTFTNIDDNKTMSRRLYEERNEGGGRDESMSIASL